MIQCQYQKVLNLPEDASTQQVQAIVLDTRRMINWYRETEGKKPITVTKFRRKLKQAQMAQGYQQFLLFGQAPKKNEMKKLRVAITGMMFPQKNNLKINASAKREEDDYFDSRQTGYDKYFIPLIAKELGCCAIGTALYFIPNDLAWGTGLTMFGTGATEICKKAMDHFPQVYSNPGGPYTNDRNDPAFMRWRTNYINNKNAIKEPLYNFEVEY